MEKAWEEIHHGADMRIPRIYKFIIKYITPLFLLLILGAWFIQEGIPVISMKNISAADKPYVFLTRIGLILLFGVLTLLVKIAWSKRKKNYK